MQNLVFSTRALKVINKSIELFHYNGFPIIGVDTIIRETKVAKMTFYNYFHSKERFVEICLMVQKERLQDRVIEMVEYDEYTSAVDKLKKLYALHTDIDGLYYLLFKAIFETKLNYPNAYTIAVRYRTWLTNEIYSQLRALNSDASFNDAKLFVYMIDGAVIQRLGSGEVEEKVLEVFFRGMND